MARAGRNWDGKGKEKILCKAAWDDVTKVMNMKQNIVGCGWLRPWRGSSWVVRVSRARSVRLGSHVGHAGSLSPSGNSLKSLKTLEHTRNLGYGGRKSKIRKAQLVSSPPDQLNRICSFLPYMEICLSLWKKSDTTWPKNTGGNNRK